MLKRKEFLEAQKKAMEYLENAHIVLTEEEKQNIEVVDFGFGDLANTGLEIVVYVNTERVCAKELVIFPHQTCAEHRHPDIEGRPGKEETFRCRWGKFYLYVPGEKTEKPGCVGPPGREEHCTVWHEIILNPGDQYTLPPDTLHWFQGGDEGAVVSEFSTRSTDDKDVFTDPGVQRETKVID